MLLTLERPFVFRPTKASKDWQSPPAVINAQDVTLQISAKVTIHAWWCPPDGWTPEDGALLYCHGNAGNLSHRGEQIHDWQKEFGVAVMIFDYPGFGRSTGKPTEKGCYSSAEASWTWVVETQKVKPEDVIILGGSLGGGAAIELAQARPFRALVVMSSFTSVPDVAAKRYPWLPVRRLMRNRFESQRKIVNCHGPIFITHGTSDRVIPFEMGRKLYETAQEPKQFYPLNGHDHCDPAGVDFYDELKRFMESVKSRST